MSSITKMVIYIGFRDEAAMARLNAWCAEHDTDREQQFEKLNMDAAGGMKVFTGQVWAMAGNYFPAEDLVEAFGSFGWLCPDDAILIVDDANRDDVEVHRATPASASTRATSSTSV